MRIRCRKRHTGDGRVPTGRGARYDADVKLLTTRQVAAMLGVSAPYVRDLIAQGKVKAKRLTPRGRWRIDESDVLKFWGVASPSPSVDRARIRRKQEVVAARRGWKLPHVDASDQP